MIDNNSINKSMKPLVSVLMPVYNSEKYIKKAIESILNQILYIIQKTHYCLDKKTIGQTEKNLFKIYTKLLQNKMS